MAGNELRNDLISEFRQCQDAQRLEELADLIGDAGDGQAIAALLDRLSGDRVQQDADAEAAVCDALVKLGVMRTDGQNLCYKFLDTRFLPPDTVRLIAKNYWLPRKYFETPAD